MKDTIGSNPTLLPKLNRVAWRISPSGQALYVESVHNDKGDRYSYTPDMRKARLLSIHECNRFVSYARQCNDYTARTVEILV